MDTNTSSISIWLPIAVIAAGLLIAGAVVWNGKHPTTSGQAPQGGTPAVDVKNIQTSGAPFVGQADAPVTLIEWSDFQCPYCKQFELNTLPQLIKDYVDAGKVKIVFMDFPFLGNDSVTAGEYNHAVWKLYPEKYMEWRAAMYNAQDEEGDKGFGNAASIDKLNATVKGIDAAKVAADVKANAVDYQAVMNAEKAEGQKLGINATPSFVLGNQIIAGAYPYATLKTAVDALRK